MEQKTEPTQAPSPSTKSTSTPSPSQGRSEQLKRSLIGQPLDVQMKMMSPIQAKGDAEGAVHAAAQKGVASGGGALPHQERIQASFGKHDVSGIKAHTGDNAKQASREMGAEAYATGDHVVLGSKSDLHTVAHEATHVVQQRGGVQLSGGVGKSGDPYEQHADQVADAVVAGKSAEGLLSKSGGSGGQAVQRSEPRRVGREVQRSTTGTTPTVDPVVQRYSTTRRATRSTATSRRRRAPRPSPRRSGGGPGPRPSAPSTTPMSPLARVTSPRSRTCSGRT